MMSNTDTQTIFTLEVYNRRKWSDRYSLTYATREEAEESARRLYHKDPDNEAGIHISTFYRIRETTTIVTTHDIQ